MSIENVKENDFLTRCRHCGVEIDTDEIKKIFGDKSDIYLLKYCSSRCYIKDRDKFILE
jgi:DNA-directed RNA polymerase subunit RPC12/RpoP